MAQAFLLIERNAIPGGTMNAFCEPPITISSPQLSMSSAIVPKPVIASTMKSAPVCLTSLPMASKSCIDPVEDSEAWINTAFTSGFCCKAASNCAGNTAEP